jgi:hypothetical protein
MDAFERLRQNAAEFRARNKNRATERQEMGLHKEGGTNGAMESVTRRQPKTPTAGYTDMATLYAEAQQNNTESWDEI